MVFLLCLMLKRTLVLVQRQFWCSERKLKIQINQIPSLLHRNITNRREAMLFWSFALNDKYQHRYKSICFDHVFCLIGILYFSNVSSVSQNEKYRSTLIHYHFNITEYQRIGEKICSSEVLHLLINLSTEMRVFVLTMFSVQMDPCDCPTEFLILRMKHIAPNLSATSTNFVSYKYD